MNNIKVAEELVKVSQDIVAGCEKLPEGPMRDNCEKKVKDKKEARDVSALEDWIDDDIEEMLSHFAKIERIGGEMVRSTRSRSLAMFNKKVKGLVRELANMEIN